MRPGYTVEHFFSYQAIGDQGVNIAHICNSVPNNRVVIAYFTDNYMPFRNADKTVAVLRIKFIKQPKN